MKKSLMMAMLLALLMSCSSKQDQTQSIEEKVIPVTTVEVKKEKAVTDLRYSGTIEAYQTIPLSFEIAGTVEKVLVDVGDEVKKGQLLATLDPSNPKNMHQIALAKYQQAKDAYDRLKSVYDKGSLPEIKWVEMETNLEQAKSSLEISKNNLDKCNLFAPVNGLIGQRNIEPGMSSILIGSSPIELVDIKLVYVKISVPENEVSKITKGMKATFSVSALNGRTFQGEVTNISPVADLISRTYEAKILVSNPDLILKPGMVCDVDIEYAGGKELVLVPYYSVSEENNQSYVYVVDLSQKRVKKQWVKTGQFYDSSLEIVSGLTPGQVIVKEGKEKLSDNCLISL